MLMPLFILRHLRCRALLVLPLRRDAVIFAMRHADVCASASRYIYARHMPLCTCCLAAMLLPLCC